MLPREVELVSEWTGLSGGKVWALWSLSGPTDLSFRCSFDLAHNMGVCSLDTAETDEKFTLIRYAVGLGLIRNFINSHLKLGVVAQCVVRQTDNRKFLGSIPTTTRALNLGGFFNLPHFACIFWNPLVYMPGKINDGSHTWICRLTLQGCHDFHERTHCSFRSEVYLDTYYKTDQWTGAGAFLPCLLACSLCESSGPNGVTSDTGKW